MALLFPITAQEVWDYFAPQIHKIEQKRRAALFLTAFVFLCFFAVSMIGIAETYHPATYLVITVLIAFAPAYFVYRALKRGVWLAYKPLSHLIARKIVGDAYRSWGIIEMEEMREHGILPDHCRVYREEGYILNLHGYRVRFQEIDAVRSSHTVSVREWCETSVGSGMYIDVELKRHLPAHTILLTKNIRSYLKMFLRNHSGEYKEIGLVSPRFMDRFVVYSTDPIEARVAFHPAFIEKFMDIAARLRALSVEASFKRDKLLIHGRYKKDLFQLGHFWRPLRLSDIEILMEELTLYADIVETLRLNPYTAF